MKINIPSKYKRLSSLLFGPFLCLPRVPIMLFTLSIGISFLLTLFLSFSIGIYDHIIDAMRGPWLDKITASWYLDPIFVHFVIALLYSVLIIFEGKVVFDAKVWSIIIASSFPFIILIIVDLLSSYVVKPSFSVPRPLDPLPEPVITAYLRKVLSYTNGKPDSMPSGFVLRQMSVFLFLTWMLVNSKAKKWIRILLGVVNIGGILIVCFSRVYRGAHTPLDVAVAIGLGTVIFWLIVLPPYNLVSLRGFHIHTIHLSTLIGGTLIILLTVMGYSNEGARYIQTMAYLIVFLGLIFVTSPLVNITGVRVFRRSNYVRIIKSKGENLHSPENSGGN